jgi:hypothetical protein
VVIVSQKDVLVVEAMLRHDTANANDHIVVVTPRKGEALVVPNGSCSPYHS